MASLILLEDLNSYMESGSNFNQTRLLQSLKLHKDETGILHNIVMALMEENSNKRLKIAEMVQLLRSYERAILDLRDFEVLRDVCRSSLAELPDQK